MKVLSILAITFLFTTCTPTEIPIITNIPGSPVLYQHGSVDCPSNRDYYWYINGDKSTKLKDVIIGGHLGDFPDSLATVYLWEYEEGTDSHLGQDTILGIVDPLHNCNSVNEILYNMGYPEYAEFWLEFYNERGEHVFLPEFELIYTLVD